MEKTFIKANPGFLELWKDDNGYFIGEPIIAWQIENLPNAIVIEAVTYNGISQCVGYVLPDGRIDNYETIYSSLDAANESFKG